MLEKTPDCLLPVKERLHRWAKWHAKGNDGGLGYPSTSTVYRVLKQEMFSERTVYRVLPTNEEAEETEGWVVELNQFDALSATALRLYYLYPGGLRTHAKGLHLSYACFQQQVLKAHYWVLAKWSGRKR